MNVPAANRLEGSRFVALELYQLAAGGSRERFYAWQFYRLSYSYRMEPDAMGQTSRWVNPGSRLLATDRAASL